MIHLRPSNMRSVLCLGAHGDDLEIGCGGTVLRWSQEQRDLKFHWIVFSGHGERQAEAQCSAAAFLGASPSPQIETHGFRDGYFPSDWTQIKETFEHIKEQVQPDVIFTHHGRDHHQDHRVISALTWNTFRDHLILEYEIPKYDGDLAEPNVFVALDEEICDKKVELLLKHFPTQVSKPWFDRDTFRGLMRLRGVHCAAPERFAEAFYARKICLG